MTWLGSLLAAIWHRPPPSELPSIQNGKRDAQIRALQIHNTRLLAELDAELAPDARRLIQTMLDDRRFLEARHDD